MNTQTKDESLQETGRCAAASIVEMVAALDVDYDRLQELRDERNDLDKDSTELRAWDDENGDELRELEAAAGECTSREEAEQLIQEDALSIEVRSGWYVPGNVPPTPEEFCILLSTGGPASRIRGELNEIGEPVRAWLEVQDWGTPWTRYFQIEQETLLSYAQCFYFGE
jgi:hypothetical protein